MAQDLTKKAGTAAAPSSAGEVAAFLDRARAVAPGGARGRLVFALDATMSRQPAWDLAVRLQAGMFDAAMSLGGLDVQLLYYRGFDECRASRWVRDADALHGLMARIRVEGGHTQIRKVLKHARDETRRARVQALVFVGDAVEEDVDDLCRTAGELGLLGVPCFMFQEGRDEDARRAFAEIARLSGGAWAPFDAGSPGQLAALLRAVAAYAAGGRAALKRLGAAGEAGARLLLERLP
jgi:hypothetical protein